MILMILLIFYCGDNNVAGGKFLNNYKVDSVLAEGGGVKIYSFFTDIKIEEHETQFLLQGSFKYIGITEQPIEVKLDKWYNKVYTAYADQFYAYPNDKVYVRTQDRINDLTYHYYGHHVD